MQRMGNDEIEALRQFYADRRQALFSYALAHLGCAAEAEDVLQGVFEKLLRTRKLPHNLHAYAFRAIRNAAIDRHRHNGHVAHYRDIFAHPPPENTPTEATTIEEAERLLTVLNGDERECVVLKIYSGLTFAEIAAVRGVSVNTAASWYRRALSKMRRAGVEGQ